MDHLNVANELLLLRGSKLTQGAFVGFMQNPDVALKLLLLPELSLAKRAAEASRLGLDGILSEGGHLRGCLWLTLSTRAG